MLFLHSLWVSRVVRWERQLSGFGRVRLQPDDSAVASAVVTASELAIWLEEDQEGEPTSGSGRWFVEPGTYTVQACASSVDCRLTTTVTLE